MLTLLNVIHDTRCTSYVIGQLCDIADTLRMYHQLRTGIFLLGRERFFSRNARMNRTTAFHKLQILLGYLFRNPCTKITVGNKKNILLFNITHDLNSGSGCYTNITNRLYIRCCIDICNNRITGILLLQCLNLSHTELSCHRTSRIRMGKNYFLLRRENLNGFSHKTDAAHQHCLLRSSCRLLTQTKRIPDIIGNLQNVMILVCMCQNTDILLFLHFDNCILQFSCRHHTVLRSDSAQTAAALPIFRIFQNFSSNCFTL